MSIHLPPLTRREFLQVSASASVATLCSRGVRAADVDLVDPHRFVFLSDTHIMENSAAMARGINMADQLRRVVAEIAAEDVRSAGVIINGDLATDGSPPTAGAYRHFARLIEPLRKRGMPIHLTMGNCDRRELFAETLIALRPKTPPVDGRLVDVLKTERANFFFLDSLYNTEQTVTKGNLGDSQVKWLARALDGHAGKPAILVAHHNINREDGKSDTWRDGGLIDSAKFVDVLRSRTQVKAFIFGHTHDWHRGVLDGIHLINLPTTAYIFDPKEPRGWVDGRLERDGMRMMLHSLDKKHPKHREQLELRWR